MSQLFFTGIVIVFWCVWGADALPLSSLLSIMCCRSFVWRGGVFAQEHGCCAVEECSHEGNGGLTGMQSARISVEL